MALVGATANVGTGRPAAQRLLLGSLAIVSALAAADCRKREAPADSAQVAPRTLATAGIREALFNELQPVALKNCVLTRYGSTNDGGYLMCENLIQEIASAYSYGIDREDNWGCQVSRAFKVPIHQYDCFTPMRPTCDGGQFVYHNECVGDKKETIDGRLFDTIQNQIAANGDAAKRILLKIDVEGAEWNSLLFTPDAVLEHIDQIPMEFHGVDEGRFLETVRKLKRTFHLVSVHFNNWSCSPAAAPFPSWAYQALWVNKRVGILDPEGKPHVSGAPPHAPDAARRPDCQQAISVR